MSAKRNNSPAVEKPMESAVDGAPQRVTFDPALLEPMTLEAVRRDLKGVKGKKYWRSLDELANTEEFQAAVEREFPSAAQEWVDPVSRRERPYPRLVTWRSSPRTKWQGLGLPRMPASVRALRPSGRCRP